MTRVFKLGNSYFYAVINCYVIFDRFLETGRNIYFPQAQVMVTSKLLGRLSFSGENVILHVNVTLAFR
jgi:hypothetical protein